jgi:hypothetical protein
VTFSSIIDAIEEERMHLLYCDETNLDPNDHVFFVYGGVSIPCEKALELHNRIEDIRQAAGVSPEFKVKFNPKPANLSHQEYRTVKQYIIDAAIQCGCHVYLSIILHQLATSPDDARRNEINRVIYHYQCKLVQDNSFGLCLIDRFSDSQIDGHLRDKFSVGLTGLPYTDPMRLEKIIGFHYSAIGQSHFSSLIDIVIGSFRYAVNAHCSQDQQRLRSAHVLLGLLEPLFIRETPRNTVSKLSLNFSPNQIRAERYRTQYIELKEYLAREGLDSSQDILSPPPFSPI